MRAEPKIVQKAVEVYENICQMTPNFFLIGAGFQLQAHVEGGRVGHFLTSKNWF